MPSQTEVIKSYVKKQIDSLCRMTPDGRVKAELAGLRKGSGKEPGEVPEIWGYFLADLPDELDSQADEPTKAQNAIYNAMTLFAVHQQSSDIKDKCMHSPNIRLGTACARLIDPQDEKSEERIIHRLNAMMSSVSLKAMINHLRSIITLLKSEDIPLDYADLAQLIFLYQFPDKRKDLKYQVARDFYHEIKQIKRNNSKEE